MSRDISQDNLEQLYSLNSENAEILLLRISYDNQTLYFARNFIDITFNSQLYTALPFDITLPDENETGSNSAELSIADVNGDIYQIIRTVDELTAEFEVISQAVGGAQNSIAIFPNMRLANASWDEKGSTFNLFREDEGMYSFPQSKMDNILLPGLY